ncbi:uncharacterized protein K460DRAFT_277613 [Cucurbitaria berberidis CBS 394.84]|uniref:Uncharacterized protein n=1 Tax=Cucurbitaria berberidis CBS 394.84 TaxID=1168544 RepID=A0A9P4GNU1_9PLEO|nr:uncharacterized protein K460DRAFT_277613 [Cucurbitaria berberidis CBS 394.84]KAF1848985.1 hypothetical protein K460DRAFT_277613 [Cucurbitaria berberidis CBS 394.84]
MPKRHVAEQKVIGPNGIKLKQIQFRSYMHDIAVYHFQAYFISIENFRSLLNRPDHGYVDTLLGLDPLHDKPLPEGDEPPEGCVEVGYMPNAFQHGGSALGFRVGENIVEWMCFDRAIDDIILQKIDVGNQGPKGKVMLFDHVADVLRGVPERRVRGANLEHKGWHDSLWKAEHRPNRLSLTWKNFGTELRTEHALRRRVYTPLAQGTSELHVDDEGHEDQDMVEKPTRLVYENEQMIDTPSRKPSNPPHSRSSSGSTVLGKKDTNTVRIGLSQTSQKVQGKRLLDGDYQ